MRTARLPIATILLLTLAQLVHSEPNDLTVLRQKYVGALHKLRDQKVASGNSGEVFYIQSEIDRISTPLPAPIAPQKAAADAEAIRKLLKLDKVAGEKDVYILSKQLRPDEYLSFLKDAGLNLATFDDLKDILHCMKKLKAAGIPDDVVLDLSTDQATQLHSGGKQLKTPSLDEIRPAFMGGAVPAGADFVMRLGPQNYGLSPRPRGREYVKWLVRLSEASK